MKTSLSKGLDAQRKGELEANFKASALFRETLSSLLEAKVDTLRRDLRKKEGYVDASWAYRQADGIGYERAIFEVISLLSSVSVEKE